MITSEKKMASSSRSKQAPTFRSKSGHQRRPSSVPVDWGEIEEELASINPDFANPRFDSFRHVLTALGSSRAQLDLQELRSQRDKVEALVDIVVEGYHSGFNRALHSYSRILALFSESRYQLDNLRRSLETAARRLNGHTNNLLHDYRQYHKLSDMLRLLNDVQAATSRALAVSPPTDNCSLAVSSLLEVCNLLARSELSRVGALNELREDIGLRRSSIQADLLSRIEDWVYDTGTHASSTPWHKTIRGKHKRTVTLGHLIDPEAPLTNHIDCLAQLGSIQFAQDGLINSMPRHVQEIVLQQLSEFQPLPAHTDSLVRGTLIPQDVSKKARSVVESCTSACSTIVKKASRALVLLSTVAMHTPSAGLQLLLAKSIDVDEARVGSLGPENAKRQCQRMWEVMQTEIQLLISDILDMSVPLNGVGRHDEALLGLDDVHSSPEWLEIPNLILTPSELTFSIAQECDTEIVNSGAGAGKEGGEQSSRLGRRALIRQILGGHRGGPGLIPALYKPVTAFVEASENVLNIQLGSTRGATQQRPGLPPLLSILRPAGVQETVHDLSTLQEYVESLVRLEFLPFVAVEVRARCIAAFGASDAFQPTPAANAKTAHLPLPAALVAEDLLNELTSWAEELPGFAPHLSGVAENVVGKWVDELTRAYDTATAGSTAARLAQTTVVARLMTQEPAAVLLGSPIAFFVGKNAETLESFISSVVANGFGTSKVDSSSEVLKILLAERPIDHKNLLSGGTGDSRQLLVLAALGEAAHHLADVTSKCMHATTPSGPPPSTSEWSITPKLAIDLTTFGLGRLGKWTTRSSQASGASEGLSYLADRQRALAGLTSRTLRLELMVSLVYCLSHLPSMDWQGPPSVAMAQQPGEADEIIASVNRTLGRIREDLSHYLPDKRKEYVLGAIAPAAPRVLMMLLPECKTFSHGGASRMCRILTYLQSTLALSIFDDHSSALYNVGKEYDVARIYFTLLTHSPEGVISTAREKPHRFKNQEWLTLFDVKVIDRTITQLHRVNLQNALAEGRAKSVDKNS